MQEEIRNWAILDILEEQSMGRVRMAPLVVVVVVALMSALMQSVSAEVTFHVINNDTGTYGGVRFAKEIGVHYTKQSMKRATEFIWRTFNQTERKGKHFNRRKNWKSVTFIVQPFDGVANTGSNSLIQIGGSYIGSYSGDVKTEITGVLYHEMTHVWQWNGNGQIDDGLYQGIADYVRFKAGYSASDWTVQPGGGYNWDDGYATTAYFLDYCNSLRNGFVALLNNRMRTGYNVSLFQELLGKTVDQLWTDYKAKYANPAPPPPGAPAPAPVNIGY